MNGNYYKNPRFPTLEYEISDKNDYAINSDNKSMIINDFLSANKGKKVNIYVSFNDISNSGIIEYVGNDFIVIRDIDNDSWKVFPIKFINYFEFNEKIIV